MTTPALLPRLDLVAAVARDLCIGRAGQLPWHLPEDLKRFKAMTTGHAILMGRKTFESVGRPLPNRRNLVISRSAAALGEGIEICGSLDEAVARARETDDAPKVIGGAEIYRLALPLATHLSITWVDLEVEGCDAHFPEFRDGSFEEIERVSAQTQGVTFVEYRRRAGAADLLPCAGGAE